MMLDSREREILRNALLQANFSGVVQAKLRGAIGANRNACRYAETLLQCAEIAQAPQPFELGEEDEADGKPGPVRKAAFRRAVVHAYAYRCAICGIRMITPNGHSGVEAAHIIPRARTHNDDVRNGLSLCRLCHWAFDELLVSVDRTHKLLISGAIHGNENLLGQMSAFSGLELILPGNAAYHPLPEALADHCERFLRAG